MIDLAVVLGAARAVVRRATQQATTMLSSGRSDLVESVRRDTDRSGRGRTVLAAPRSRVTLVDSVRVCVTSAEYVDRADDET